MIFPTRNHDDFTPMSAQDIRTLLDQCTPRIAPVFVKILTGLIEVLQQQDVNKSSTTDMATALNRAILRFASSIYTPYYAAEIIFEYATFPYETLVNQLKDAINYESIQLTLK